MQKLLSVLRNDFFSTSAVDITLIVLSTITGILTARVLGPIERGNYAIILLWPSVIASIGSLGVKEALVYYQASFENDKSKLTGVALVLAIGQSAVLLLAGWLLIPILVQNRGAEVVRVSLTYLSFIPLNIFSTFFIGVLQGGREFSRFNVVRMSVNLLYLLSVLVLIGINQISLLSLSLSLLFANLVTALLAVMLSIERFHIRFDMEIGLIKDIYWYGIRNHLGTISFLLNQRLDQVIMALLLASEQLGLYTIAVSYSGLARVASSAFSTLVFPRIASADQGQRRLIISDFSRASVTSTIVIGLLMFLLAPLLIPFVYGTAYRDSIFAAQVLTIATVFVGIGQTWSSSFLGLGNPMISSRAELISLSITGIGLAILLPLLGMIGAAYISLVAYLVTTVYLFVCMDKLLDLRAKELLLPIALPKLIPAIIKLSNSD